MSTLRQQREDAVEKARKARRKDGRWAHNERHDAYYDVKTFRWKESGCGDSRCEFCHDRPPTAQGLT